MERMSRWAYVDDLCLIFDLNYIWYRRKLTDDVS